MTPIQQRHQTNVRMNLLHLFFNHPRTFEHALNDIENPTDPEYRDALPYLAANQWIANEDGQYVATPEGKEHLMAHWKQRAKEKATLNLRSSPLYDMAPVVEVGDEGERNLNGLKVECPKCGRKFCALRSPYTILTSKGGGLTVTESYVVSWHYLSICVACGTEFHWQGSVEQ